jgi:hypothetical protein
VGTIADALARKSITTYSDVANTSIIKTAGPEGNPPSTTPTGLQNHMKNTDHTKSTKHSPVTYLRALVPIQLP